MNERPKAARRARRLGNDSGQGLVEYALILSLVAIALVGILLALRNATGNLYNKSAAKVSNSTVCAYGTSGSCSGGVNRGGRGRGNGGGKGGGKKP